MVRERLGHEDIPSTVKTCSHVLPTLPKGAAEKRKQILGGKKGADRTKRAAEGG